MIQYVTRELLITPTITVEIIVRTNVIATASFTDRGAVLNDNIMLNENYCITETTSQCTYMN